MKMSFCDNTLNREKLKKFIEETDKPIKYTYGLVYKNPTTLRKPVTKEQAYEIIEKEYLLDAEEKDDYIHLNAFSGNDML